MKLFLWITFLASCCSVLHSYPYSGAGDKSVEEIATQLFLLHGDEDVVSRVPRDVNVLLQLLAGVPGLAELNVSTLITAATSLLNKQLSHLECCKGMDVPAMFADSLMSCAREPFVKLLANVTLPSNDTLEPPVESPQICNIVQDEMCIGKCAFENLNMLAEDGLPSSAAIVAALPGLALAPQHVKMLQPAVRECEQHIRSLQNPDVQTDSCWAANVMLACVQQKLTKECPVTQRQRGMTCLISLIKSFVHTLPSKARDLAGSVLHFITNLLEAGK